MPKKHPFFATLSNAQWSLLQPHLEQATFNTGATVTTETTATDLFWLIEGSAELTRETPFGPQTLAKLSAPQSFGEMAFIDGKAMNFDVQITSPTLLYHLSSASLWKLFAKEESLGAHFFRSFWPGLAQKLNLANQQLKRFFAQDSTPPPDSTALGETPARPAWFTPPQTPLASSISLDATDIKMTQEQKRSGLQDIGLTPSEMNILFELGEELAVPANQPIFKEGNFGDTLYFVLQGEVRISKSIPGVGEEALAVLEAGEIFGEMALVAPNAIRSADCYAHEKPAVLLAFRLHVLQQIKGHPEELAFLQSLCKMMAHRVRESYSKLISWKMMRGGFF